MKTLVLSLALFGISAFAQIPRQKIKIMNQRLHKELKVAKVDYFTNIPSEEFYFVDPYQKNKKNKALAFSLENLFKHFAPDAKSVKLTAINLYQVIIQRNTERAKTTYVMYKQDGNWMENSDLGPLRVIRKGLGIIPNDKITKEGIDWIWMINEISFIYE
ncbi:MULTISPECIES: hypothetical protein [unclassified Halobacteriovorax]|uniref:hypothetical protein n=1 Tax=unclassified Halobacteriovorax TaxID=2639665 RepID=UPI00399C44A8